MNIIFIILGCFIIVESFSYSKIKKISKLNMVTKTFDIFVQHEVWRNPELNDIQPILQSIETSCNNINKLMRSISETNLFNDENKYNIQGENQKKLDILSNNIMKNSLSISGNVKYIISEEEENPFYCSSIIEYYNNDKYTNNDKYCVVFDPLDGSSNIESGLPTGTIFGIYKINKFNDNYINKGSELIVSGYCLYSASTQLVLCMNNKVSLFMLDDSYNKFILTKSNILIPKTGNIYSVNTGDDFNWDPKLKSYIENFKMSQPKKTLRYFGALVADIHNILLNGGIFYYPTTSSYLSGKIRLVYEAHPISHIITTAGGLAINGNINILDIKTNNIHQRTPLYIGSYDLVNDLKNYLN